jgi:ABC-type bacteriocin/lantibiotic exporter with double-glycine peptidase domain
MQGNDLENVLPKIGIFSIASFKLIPSFNKIINSIQNVKYTKVPLDVIVTEIQSLNFDKIKESNIELNFYRNIQIQNINFCYPGTNIFVLNNININIIKGQSVGFIGTTGSGKSTLLDLILGLLTPTSGFVKVDDIDINENPKNWQSRIGYVPQFIYLVDGTLRNNIAFGIPDIEIDENKILKALKLANLEDFVSKMPLKLNTQVGERGIALSGGQKQRVGIARALYNNPEILVLDEATSSLDIETEKSVMESIRLLHGKKTIINIAHRYSTIMSCDIVYKIENGCIINFGKPKDVI